jgi:glutamate dehydrogenase (NAD(P)+)
MSLARTEKDGKVIYTATSGGRVLGYVAINSTVRGKSCGGLRMLPDVSADEIVGLARAMTLKYGFLRLPQGGAKAGVVGDGEATEEERYARFEEFGREIGGLLRTKAFVPGVDMGTDAAAIRHMMKAAGARVSPRELKGNNSGLYTAVSVMAGISAAARHRGVQLAGATAAVEGFGKVGAPLARLLAEASVKVVAVSNHVGAIHNAGGIDIERLTQLVAEKGSAGVEAYADAEPFDRRLLAETDADILCPCARHDSITAENAGRVAARIVAAGANNPVTPEAEVILAKRRALCLPDFVTNCGGVLGGTMEFAGVRREKIVAFVRRYVEAAVAAMLAEAEDAGAPLRAVAERIALDGFRRTKEEAERETFRVRAMNAGLALYRWGLVPVALMRPLAEGYFERRLAAGPGRGRDE